MSKMSSSTTETPAVVSTGGNGGTTAKAPAGPRVPIFSVEAWAPLKVPLFRSLYIATSVAQIGTWIREAGGPILMGSLMGKRPETPDMVARVLLVSSLPICLFSVFAGALADVLDRRRLLIVTQVWMLVFSALLGLLTVTNHIDKWGLLILTFLVGTGTAAAGPALQGLLPELVPRKDLPLAINLNSVALNVARAIGPALLIVVLFFIQDKRGIGASFFVTAASFIWAIWVLVTWKREPQRAAVHGEDMWAAIRSGFQYTIHSPANRAILLRVFTFIVPAVVMWSQVPVIATRLLGAADDRKLQAGAALFAFVGLGAILGVLVMPGLQKRYRIDPVVNVCTLLFAGGLIVLSQIHHAWMAWIVMAFLGVNWVIIPTNFNTATQTSVPLWVKGRAISFYLTVLFGSFTIAAGIWGRLTAATSISTSLIVGGITMAACLVLAKWFPLTLNEGLDLTPAFAGAPAKPVLPDIVPPMDPAGGPQPASAGTPGGLDPQVNPTIGATGQTPLQYQTPAQYQPKSDLREPVEVSLQYDVDPQRVREFIGVMKRVGQQRRRNGAWSWNLEPAAKSSNGSVSYREVILYRSKAEYIRQPARMSKNDLSLLDAARAYHTSAGDLPGSAERISPDAVDSLAPAKEWLLAKATESFDRTFDEIAAMFDRFATLHDRERNRSKR